MRAWLVLATLFAWSCGPASEHATLKSSESLSYQIGSEWGKKVVDAGAMNQFPSLERIAQGTGRLSGGTGFYLGKFAGEHIVATNHHVCPAGFACLGGMFQLPVIDKSFKLARFIGTWDSVDLSLLAITVTAQEEALLATLSNPFRFEQPISRSQALITVGFGIAGNSKRELVYNADEDCRVFSGRDEFRLLADPDAVNPVDYRAWSFANGCDVSHGDSGSAMIDRENGAVVGLIWTGKIPKIPEIQSSAYLDQLEAKQDPAIWTELSYAVPALKIKEALEASLELGQIDSQRHAVIAAILETPPLL